MWDVVSFYFLNNITTYVISIFGVALNGNHKLNRVKIFSYLKKVRMGGKRQEMKPLERQGAIQCTAVCGTNSPRCGLFTHIIHRVIEWNCLKNKIYCFTCENTVKKIYLPTNGCCTLRHLVHTYTLRVGGLVACPGVSREGRSSSSPLPAWAWHTVPLKCTIKPERDAERGERQVGD